MTQPDTPVVLAAVSTSGSPEDTDHVTARCTPGDQRIRLDDLPTVERPWAPREPADPHHKPRPSMTLGELAALPAVVDLVTAGRALGLGRSKSYQLARADQFPVRLLRAGRTYLVPTADLLALLGQSTTPTSTPEEDHGG